MRLVHLTDIHVQPKGCAAEGMARAIRHAQAQNPEFILTGGDQVMNVFGVTEADAKAQWELFDRILRREAKLPVEHCIGNHDVFGWGDRGGKRWAMEVLGLDHPYRSFDRGGWHFVILDSTYEVPDSYTAKLDEEQFEWFADDLKRTTKPTLVVSHIPILSAAAFLDGDNLKDGDWSVPGAWMHVDVKRIKDLFLEHRCVKACLSGHLHLVDRVDYNGVTYFCNGAVCGGWWGGNYQECEPGYAVVDLEDDGRVECRYVPWGFAEIADAPTA